MKFSSDTIADTHLQWIYYFSSPLIYNKTNFPPKSVRFTLNYGRRLLIFECNSQSNYTPPCRDPEPTCWLARIVSGTVWATLFVSHLQSQDSAQTDFWAHTLDKQLEESEENLAEFDYNFNRLRSRTASLMDNWWIVPLSFVLRRALFYIFHTIRQIVKKSWIKDVYYCSAQCTLPVVRG